jgi:hypothetical protein
VRGGRAPRQYQAHWNQANRFLSSSFENGWGNLRDLPIADDFEQRVYASPGGSNNALMYNLYIQEGYNESK